MASFAQTPMDVKGILAALADPATTVDAATRLTALGNSQPEVRKIVGRELPAMLLETKHVLVVQNEARVAGALRLESTIPSLIQLLSWYNGDLNTTRTTYHQLLDDPVARALYEIGAPAEPALKEALESKDIKTRVRVVNVLVLTNTSESRAILRKHLEKEPSPQLKKSIQLNLNQDAN
jgi:HEAT repeat protein